MSRTAASVTQAELARIMRAARKAGARLAVVKLKDGTTVRVPLTEEAETEDTPLAAQKEIVL